MQGVYRQGCLQGMRGTTPFPKTQRRTGLAPNEVRPLRTYGAQILWVHVHVGYSVVFEIQR